MAFSKVNPDHLHPAALLNTYDTHIATAKAERVIKTGGRACVMASSIPHGISRALHLCYDGVLRDLPCYHRPRGQCSLPS